MALNFAVLKRHDFRLMLGTRMFGTMALQAQAVIVGWQIYSLTHDPFMLGLAGLTEAVPAIIGALFSGHIVDVGRPYAIFRACIATLLLNMLMLLLLGGGFVQPPGGNILPWIYGGVFISGLARSFIMPSSMALQLHIVPREQVSAAAAWMSSIFQIGIISGPAIAGLVYGGYGVTIAWMLPFTLMAIEMVLVLGIGHGPRHYRHTHQREKAAQSILNGWKFIFANRVLLSVMMLDMLAVLFGGAVAMLPAYADQVLHVGAQGLGTLRAAPALGAVVTALLLAVRPFGTLRATTLLSMVAGFGLCIIGFGLSTSFTVSLVMLAASGAFDSVSMVIRGTLVQLLTPEAMRGRVSSVNSMFIISSNEIGAFESGLAARVLGLVPSVVFGGAMTLLVVAVTATLSPKFRRTAVKTE